MIIAGNSHVQLFQDRCLLRGAPDEVVRVAWLAHLSVLSFTMETPEGQRARALFKEEPGWRIAVMGDSDIAWALHRSTRLGVTKALSVCVNLYARVFDELSVDGRFAWLIGPAVRAPLPGMPAWARDVYDRHSPKEVWACAEEFVALVTRVCDERGIPVINPTAQLIHPDGSSRAGLFEPDDAHLRPEHIDCYLREIRAKLDVAIEGRAPVADHDGLARGPEPEQGVLLTDEVARARLRDYVKDRTQEAGFGFDVTDDTDFGKFLDSLTLTDIYSHALDLLGLGLAVDVDVREISSVRSMIARLCERRDLSVPA